MRYFVSLLAIIVVIWLLVTIKSTNSKFPAIGVGVALGYAIGKASNKKN